MKRKGAYLAAVLAFVFAAAGAATALAGAIEGPDEVYEGCGLEITFNSPAEGGMEGDVAASSNLSYQGITTSNMGSSLSDESHVFSLFGDPVTYAYCVSASEGERVSVSLQNAAQSDENGNVTQLQDQTWSQIVQASATPTPTGSPTGAPTGTPSYSPTYPTSSTVPVPTQAPYPSAPVQPVDWENVNIDIVNNNYNTNNNIVSAVRYPAYAPRPVPQRTIYRSYDGMPKMGDNSSRSSYWALLMVGALLAVVAIIAATQVWLHSERCRSQVKVTILR